MARRKLKPGVHSVVVGGKRRKVRVLKTGQWRFLKGSPRKASTRGRKAKAKPRAKRRRTSPGRRKTMARRKSSLPNRLINVGLLALAFAGPLRILLGGGDLRRKAELILLDATAGMVRPGGKMGKFDAGIAASFYGPVAAAFILFEVKKMAMKKFRF